MIENFHLNIIIFFQFGGKLVTFGVEPIQTGEPQKTPKVSILQIVTDNNLVEESQKLENALQTGQVIEFCNYKIESVSNSTDSEIWKFILVIKFKHQLINF